MSYTAIALMAIKNYVIYVTLALSVMLPATAEFVTTEATESYMIGDSTAWRAQDKVLNRTPGWEWHYDAVRGTRVDTLPQRADLLRAEYGPAPDVVVVALGTNPSGAWRCQDYAKARWKFWKRTRFVLVTPYVTPQNNSTMRYRRTTKYARCMNRLANRLPNTQIAHWRYYAQWKTNRLVLDDGVHQTPIHGERVWAREVIRAATR